MKASLRWLRELCPELPDDVNALAARLTGAGLEVEGLQPYGLAAEACVVASVVSVRAHPSRAGLSLVTVDRGAPKPESNAQAPRGPHLEVVCGAPNVPNAGGFVVLAPVGAHLPAKGLTVEPRSIGGVTSEGMLCSEAELGLSDEADGILVLPSSTAMPGISLAAGLPSTRDSILELSITPNRGDALGHVGLAREAAALFDVPFAVPAATLPELDSDRARADPVSVSIEDAERCPHYGAAVLAGAKVDRSPLEVRFRLSALGVRPISNVVDVTNLIMLEFGHPMHAFDLDKVPAARIVVRRARDGEKLVTLDGVERVLSTDDLVICDEDGPVALAGVMGGGKSEITSSTSRILLECAYFEPRGVRRASRRHALHSESSHRFERGVDWGDTPAALLHATALVARLAGARALGKPRIFEARALVKRRVELREERLGALLGAEVDAGDARAILRGLGFTRCSSRPGVDAWEVPTHRPDVAREVDLIEEVARVRGYDKIPSRLPAISPSRPHASREKLARSVRRAAVELGLSESIPYAFVSPEDLQAVGAPPPAVTLRNPLREDVSVMRTSLVPGLLRILSRARRHGERDARLFAVGTVFVRSAGSSEEERLSFASVLAGKRPQWLGIQQTVDVWDAKGLAEGLVARLLRRPADVCLAASGQLPPHLHPRGASWVEVDGERVGAMGPLHPNVMDAFELADPVVLVELDLEALRSTGVRSIRFVPLPRFPANLRDIAVVVPDDVAAGDLVRAARDAAGDLAEEVTLFDRFVGGSIAPGHASLALRIVYRAHDRTLGDAEVDARHADVISRIRSRFGAQLRV
jgi:phenylalanyl-tRNA synthetase beta chain